MTGPIQQAKHRHLLLQQLQRFDQKNSKTIICFFDEPKRWKEKEKQRLHEEQKEIVGRLRQNITFQKC